MPLKPMRTAETYYPFLTSDTNPFFFPFGGEMHNPSSKRQTAPSKYIDGVFELLNIPAGEHNSGVIRRVGIISQVGGSQVDDFKKMIFNIAYDGEETPSVSVPFASLVGLERTSGVDGNWYPTDDTMTAAKWIPKSFQTPFLS